MFSLYSFNISALRSSGKVFAVDLIWQYKSVLFAIIIAIAYFFFIRPRLKAGVKAKEQEGPTYVCDQCGDMDCDCHPLEESEDPAAARERQHDHTND
ncbi:hypothetical protein Dalk_3026 [Desulfatibacillum aliphaticivorans]|uniref:Uncharacterized protein n=1 Tax=Desulfatibacillum aliphaticivorans TaxID=218208 RepID=B8FL81_DESAL|nr:hypothetical protein Dalk_3026 [Desulfatibacillum aliphaticivorans]